MHRKNVIYCCACYTLHGVYRERIIPKFTTTVDGALKTSKDAFQGRSTSAKLSVLFEKLAGEKNKRNTRNQIQMQMTYPLGAQSLNSKYIRIYIVFYIYMYIYQYYIYCIILCIPHQSSSYWETNRRS